MRSNVVVVRSIREGGEGVESVPPSCRRARVARGPPDVEWAVWRRPLGRFSIRVNQAGNQIR